MSRKLSGRPSRFSWLTLLGKFEILADRCSQGPTDPRLSTGKRGILGEAVRILVSAFGRWLWYRKGQNQRPSEQVYWGLVRHQHNTPAVRQGQYDPWRDSTVSSDFRPGGPLQSTANLPVKVLPGGVHCSDLYAQNSAANPSLKLVVDDEVAILSRWVAEYYTINKTAMPGAG